MVIYVILGLKVLLIAYLTVRYRLKMKQAPSQEQLGRLVLSILKRGQSDV
ncbi:hypothetical protein M6D81_15040 [Paenibacillus sp. J5C_2022]|nr:hypothetical protein [Paenibacillus sp. J5C2022]MCU6710010.1 hypothetical protein [Paenibacillus sp. J5C2022]